MGGPKRFCDGMTRRDLLTVGSLGLMGLAARPASAATLPHFGRAKSCILMFLYGAASQLETFDPKPDAPSGIRGEFKCIPTSVPGVNFCEGLPRLARVMDKMSVVRSLTHPHPLHGAAFALTGIPRISGPEELNPRDPVHHPYIGSVVDYADRLARRPGSEGPRNLLLPWSFSSQRVGEVARAGPYGGYLGSAYDPIATEFVGEATVKARKTLLTKVWEDNEPYRGIHPDGRFRLGGAGADAVAVDRLDRRRTLLEQLESARRDLDQLPGSASIDRNRSSAYALLASEKIRRAFDLGQETAATRESYGMTLFGQASLTARRLVEAGSRFVSVFWDEYGLAGSGWDTHFDHFSRMKDELLPGLDLALSGLLTDLDNRGILDETLVICVTEHGRTPTLSLGQGGGRDHWSRCYSSVMAGGGIARGKIIGRSDKIASDPAERPVSPKDLLATAYHLLGIDPGLMLADRLGRPLPAAGDGVVVPELLA
ncbi:DUF1501 domain-containing protein [Tundrisphaera sp. TA3]|uniref:DUF1501 domain-containing protein n=1 Tax=Tundrisphaera sp. TA3 TaxID=3435775 RepID=UPI003EBBB7B4